MSEAVTPRRLFHEPGASWYWVLAGPLAAAVMLYIEVNAGIGPKPGPPICFLVLVSGFLAVQVKAARIHTSVDLTSESLRQGTETISVDEIVRIFPEPEPEEVPQKWQSARALGELAGVPKGRTGIGLKLDDGRLVQAWARRHRDLRGALTELVAHRDSENLPPGASS